MNGDSAQVMPPIAPDPRAELARRGEDAYGAGTSLHQAAAAAAQAGDGDFLLDYIRVLEAEQESEPADLSWLSPQWQGSAKNAVRRLEVICQLFPDLFVAMLVAMATHQSAPRAALAKVFKQFHPEAQHLTPADLEGLLTSIWNGGRQAFDAVLRTRKSGNKGAVALSWVKEDL